MGFELEVGGQISRRRKLDIIVKAPPGSAPARAGNLRKSNVLSGGRNIDGPTWNLHGPTWNLYTALRTGREARGPKTLLFPRLLAMLFSTPPLQTSP